mgnify:CR=1 FL=1
MGQKIRPTGFRLGLTEGWRSQWYADKKHFGDYLVEDQKVRRYIKKEYYYCGISEIEIDRTRDRLIVKVYSARPGLMIGRKGIEVERLTNALEELTDRSVEISIEEVDRPELNAQLVAEEVAQQIERRRSFRRTLKKTADMTMEAGAEGVRIQVAGRLGGSDMSRREHVLEGSIPLHTLRAEVDYGFTEASTKYGPIGVKVWINRGLLRPGETIADRREREKKNGSNA